MRRAAKPLVQLLRQAGVADSDAPRVPCPAAWLIVAVALGAIMITHAVALAAAAAPQPPTALALAPASAVVPIPVPEIAERARDVAALLRQTDARLAEDRRVPDIEERLPKATAWIAARLVATTETLSSSPSSSALANLTDSWTLTRSRLDAWNQTLAAVASGLERQQSQLETLRATWAASASEALASGAPAPVLDRINATVASIIGAHQTLGDERARVLRVQDRVVKEMARCDDVLGKITRARDELVGGIFTRDSAPIWHDKAKILVFSDAGPRLRRSLDDNVELIHQYFGGQLVGLALQAVLLVVALVLLGRARQRVAAGSHEPPGSDVFQVRTSAALVLVLVATPWLYPHAPRAVTNSVAVLIFVPVVVIVRKLAPRPFLRPMYALASCFVVDRVRDLCADLPQLERSVFLVEMIFGIAFLALALHSESVMARQNEAPRAWRAIAPFLWVVAMAVLAFAVVAGAVGYMRLARSLGTSILASGYAALILYAAVRIADGLWAYLLAARPSSSLRMVQEHRERLQRAGGRAARWLAIGVWGCLTAEDLGMGGAIQSSVASALGARYARGSMSVSVGDVVAFVLTVAAAFFLSSVVRFVLREEIYPRSRLAHGQSYALSILLHYTVLVVGFLFAASALGLDLTRVTILAGAFGVGVGIGLQNVVANFVAGVIILLEQRITPGDSIETGDLQGEVREIGFRASTIRTWSGADVIVPNSRLTSERVTNWTMSDRRCRVDIDVAVVYTADTAHVLELLRKTAGADLGVMAAPAPVAVCTGYRDSGLGFQLRAWTARFDDADDVRSRLVLAVHAALVAARVEIALPQRDVYIRSEHSDPGDVTGRTRGR
jgi:potassium-dependent mechanosensitive channel